MRIKPAFVTGTATAVALAAVGIVVMATEPSQARPLLVWLLWAGIFLSSWGLLCTVLLVIRQSIAQSVWTALPPAIAGVGLLMALREGVLGTRLLESVILATLVLSVGVWWQLRRMHRHAGHTRDN
jgi:peptidoglycan/LPS O-acetylase OafA/YrhL